MILTIWGASYLWSCVLFVSAPGVPFELRYKSPNGTLTLRADAYSLDWERGTALIVKPRVTDPAGREFVRVNQVSAVGLNYPFSNVIVRGDLLVGTMRRLPTGRFEIQDFLPERTGPTSQIPFSVSLDTARVLLVDMATTPTFKRWVTARDIDVRGVGENWLATAAVDLQKIGSLRASVQNLPNEGVLIRGTTTGLQLRDLLAHLKRAPEGKNVSALKDFQADSLLAVGPVAVFIPKDKAFQIETRAHVVGDGVSFRDYSADHAEFEGAISDTGARGRATARQGRMDASFDGSIVWRDGPVLGGKLVASAPNPGDLPSWLRKIVPAQLSFNQAHLEGWLDYREPTGVRLDSRITASRGTAFGETVSSPDVDLAVDASALRLTINSGSWANTKLTGAVLVGLKSPTLAGAITANKVNLASLASRFGAQGISGTGKVSAILGGTRTKPQVLLQADGQAAYRSGGTRLAGNFRAAGTYDGSNIHVDRATVRTDAGFLRAIGTIGLKGNRLNLKLDANGVQLNKLREDLEGNLTTSGLLQGTFKDPRFTGRTIALGVKVAGQDIPFGTADVTATRERLLASNLRVIKGSGEVTGDVALNLRSRGISGELAVENLLLNEYLGSEALGTVNMPRLTLGGTLDKPRAAGEAYGENLILGGVRVDKATIVSSLLGTVARIDSATAVIGEGTLHAEGTYDYAKKTGSITASATDLSLERITPPGKGAANVSGALNGTARADFKPNGKFAATASGSLREVALNKTEFGGGNWELGFDGTTLTGGASIGRLDRFFILENVRYDREREDISAQVSVLNGALKDLYTASAPFFAPIPPDLRSVLDQSDGNLDATVAFDGPLRDPNVNVKVFDARDLIVKNQSLGTLSTSLTRVGTLWQVERFAWSGPQGDLRLSEPARIDTNGQMYADGQFMNIDLSYIGLIDPTWARITGNGNLWFTATGATAAPAVHASFKSSNDKGFEVAGTTETFRLNLDSIDLSQSQYLATGGYTGGIVAQGAFFYRGLAGDVTAKLPLNYPLEIPDGQNIEVALSFPHVEISDLAQYAQFLDMERTNGSLSGIVTIGGPKSDLALGGSVTATASSVALTGIQTSLKATVANVALKNNQIILSLTGQGSDGGMLSANLSAGLPDLRTTIDQMARGDTESLMRIPLQGTATAEGFNVRQAAADKELGTYHATVNSQIKIAGPAAEPTISGRVGVSDTNVLLPTIFQQGGPSAAMLFNPKFELPIELDDVARFRTSTADVALSGGGYLGGSLKQPNFTGSLNVESGQLRLPTARVTLDEGGTIRPSYSVNSNGDTITRVDVNLEGHTAVTASRYGDTVQRYDISLAITGDLLTEGGLNLRATSDPPDLSQDEILALLGQTDLLKTIESGTTQSQAEKRIREALVSFAVPALTDPITSKLAQGLGLEYLNVEYNPFEGASLAFAKALGKGVMIQGRRQISPPVGNLKTQYDLRLTYRIPTRNRTLSRLVFSVGLDQDRPWKVGLQYGFRF